MSVHQTRYHLKAAVRSNKGGERTLLHIISMKLGIYEQQVGDQSCCWQTWQTQRFIQLINVFLVALYLAVYLYWSGFISCQWARSEAPWLSSSGPNLYSGCDDRIRGTLWLLSGIQMSIPLPSAISSLSLSFVISPPLFSLPSPPVFVRVGD